MVSLKLCVRVQLIIADNMSPGASSTSPLANWFVIAKSNTNSPVVSVYNITKALINPPAFALQDSKCDVLLLIQRIQTSGLIHLYLLNLSAIRTLDVSHVAEALMVVGMIKPGLKTCRHVNGAKLHRTPC